MVWEVAPTGRRGRQTRPTDAADRRGRQPDYSDASIQTCLTMKVLFVMALRQIKPCRTPLARVTMARRVRRELAAPDRPGLDGAELQHPQPPPEDPEGQHPLTRLASSVAPADRHRVDKRHRFERTGEGEQGRGRRRVERPQAWRHQTPRPAQDPHPLPGTRMEHSPRRGID